MENYCYKGKKKGAETYWFSAPLLLSGLLDSNQRPRAPQKLRN